METLRKTIQNHRATLKDDDLLISELNALIKNHGSVVCQITFQVLASLDLPQKTALDHWKNVIEHRDYLSTSLNRKIALFSAICDYFSAFTDFLQTPKLIEAHTYSQIIEETSHDNLTSLFNRPYFEDFFEQTLSLARRYDTDLSVLFLDVDNFKDINDTYGHSTGDEVLKKIAEIILKEKRESDIAARYGGEEFILLMPHTNSISAFVLGERVRKKIAQKVFSGHGKPFSLTISGGLASYPIDASTSHDLLNQADSALYLAKGAGKNTISLFKEEKRRYLRVKFKESIQIKELGFTSTQVVEGVGKDICIGGILFQNKQAYPIGSRIQVSIPTIDKEPLLLIGTVVRLEAFTDNSFDIGMTISFKEMDKIANTEIAKFLHEKKAL